MKMLRDLVLAIFVSPEFLIAAAALVLYEVAPSVFRVLGDSLSSRNEAFKWVSLAPAAVLVFTLKCAKDALLPKDERAELLAAWPDFYILKNRVLVGLFYVFATVCATVGVWASGADIKRVSISGAYAAALAINLTAAATVWYASVQVGIHLRRANVRKT
jgi:hypothetical protein